MHKQADWTCRSRKNEWMRSLFCLQRSSLFVSAQSRTSFKIASSIVWLAGNFFVNILLKGVPWISANVFVVDSGVRLAPVVGVSGVCCEFAAGLAFSASK